MSRRRRASRRTIGARRPLLRLLQSARRPSRVVIGVASGRRAGSVGEEVLFNIVDCYLPLVVDVPALDDLGEEGPHDRRELLGVGVGEDVQGRPVRQRPDHVLRDGGRRRGQL